MKQKPGVTKVKFDIGKFSLVAIGSALSFVLGGFDTVLKVLLGFMGLDYLTGILCAVLGKSKHGDGLSSYIGFQGIIKKVMILLAVMVGFGIDQATGQPVARNLVVAFFLANEGLSVLENISLAGVPIPSFLRKLLEASRDSADQGVTEGKT
jgi:toxin secretion/phage lysis holin